MEEDSVLIEEGGYCDGCAPSVFGFEDCSQCPCYNCNEICGMSTGEMCEGNKKLLPKQSSSALKGEIEK